MCKNAHNFLKAPFLARFSHFFGLLRLSGSHFSVISFQFSRAKLPMLDSGFLPTFKK